MMTLALSFLAGFTAATLLLFVAAYAVRSVTDGRHPLDRLTTFRTYDPEDRPWQP